MIQKSILELENIIKCFNPNNGIFSSFKGNNGIIPAVDGVNFYIKENETTGLVGESKCGKTTIGRIILRLTNPTFGRVVFDGRDITALTAGQFRLLRKQIQMIFKDLDASLNTKMRIRDILKEAIKVHHQLGGSELERRMSELLENVNLKKGKLSNFPYELSGGEKRRVGIARALAVGARFLVADEPTNALDVSIQAQVVNLLKDLQKNLASFPKIHFAKNR